MKKNILRLIGIIILIVLYSELNISFYAEKYTHLMPILGAILTGLITWMALQYIDNQAKKRWMNEGYLKRKIELEIEIRKFLLNLNSYFLWQININEIRKLLNKSLDNNDKDLIDNFNKHYEKLFKHLDYEEKNRISTTSADDIRISTLLNNYLAFNQINESLVQKFHTAYIDISELKTIFKYNSSESPENILYGDVLQLAQENPEHFKKMIESYITLISTTNDILKITEKNIPQQ